MDESAAVTADVVEVVDVAVVDEQSLSPQGAPCEACGSPVEPGDKFCPACGCPQPTRSVAVEAELIEDDQKHFRCNACGAEVATDPDQRSYVCPFCDSTYVVEFSPDQTNRQRPEFVIGFAVTPEQALAKFRQWLSSNQWFRPGDLPQAQIEEKLRGVYLPFWSFSMLAQSNWSATIGEYWYKTETYTTTDANGKTVTRTRRVRKTEWWPLSGRHHQYYAGYLVSGSKGLPQQQAQRIKPFQLPALKRYEPYYLAGWLSEEYSVQRAEALQICQHEFYRREQANTAAFLPGDTYSNLDVRTTFSHINSDLCLLPVYLLSYRYRDKLYRFMVNGQTGKTAGDKPLSWRRIGVVIAIAVAVIAIIILIFLLVGGGLSALEG
jgi:hypothetical protein